jgi:hypothetical protein
LEIYSDIHSTANRTWDLFDVRFDVRAQRARKKLRAKNNHLRFYANEQPMKRIPIGRRVGEDHQNAVLTNDEVQVMRDMREQGRTYEWLADKFEVSKSSVAKICKYQRR